MSSKRGGNSTPKPLKGVSVDASSGTFDVLSANTLLLNSVTINGLISGATLDQVIISNATIINSVIGEQGPNLSSFTNLTTSGEVTFNNYNETQSLNWNPNTGTLTLNGQFDVNGCSTLGNISICQNTIQAVSGNDIIISPQPLGTIYLEGPITNIISTGNFLSFIPNGNVQFIANKFINLTSQNGPINLNSLGPQTFSTIDGNINLNTQTGLTLQYISQIINTKGNLQITTVSSSNLQSGDIINITNSNSYPTIDGPYIVTSIINPTTFNLSTSNLFGGLISSGNSGTFLQTPNNNINLNASAYINIPCNIPLTFCNTENTISGNSNGLLITSNSDITFNVPYNSLVANSSGQFNTSNSHSIIIPQYTALQFGSNGNTNLNFDGNNFNLNNINTSNITNPNLLTNININSDKTYINSTDTFIYDPNPTISYYTTYDQSDRGIQFSYFDTTITNGQSITSGPHSGWFGYKSSTKEFTFLTDTVLSDSNGSEIITGTLGKLNTASLSVDIITINSGGSLDIGCGNIFNVNEIIGCNNTINLNAGTNVNFTASNLISFNTSKILIPNNTPITFSTNGTNIKENTNGNLSLVSSKNINLTTISNGSIILPIATRLCFDGISSGNSNNIISNSSGDLTITSKTNIYLKSNSNVIIPSNTPILFGNNTIASQSITGNTSGIFIITKSGSLNLISNTNVNIISSLGNLLLTSLYGDTQLFNSNGNVRILPNQSLIFNTSNTSNSILTDPFGNFILNGPLTSNTISNNNFIQFTNTNTIDLSATNKVNIPTGVALNLSSDLQRYLITNTNGNLLINNQIPNTSTIINATNTLINNSGGTLSLTNNTTNILSTSVNLTSNSLILSGTSPYTLLSTPTSGSYALFNVQNVKFQDPILSLANYKIINSSGNLISDNRDRGIEYNYFNTSTGNMSLGWFGWKNSTGQFSFYSQAVNNNEIISGTLGTLSLGNAIVYESISFANKGIIDMACGTISNVNTITGCNGTVNIYATDTINSNATNINLNGNVTLPYSTPLSFGTSVNSISTNSSGTMIIAANDGIGTIVLNGNLQIYGSTNIVYSTVTSYKNPLLIIGGVTGPVTNDHFDRGILFNWHNDSNPQQGFFGYSNAAQAFEFIQYATNNNGIISGSLGNVQFGNGSFNNLNINCGTISNVSLITSCTKGLNISSLSTINISSNNTIFSPNSSLNFTNTNISFSSSNGNLNITSQTNGIFLNSGFLQITKNSPILFGSTNISISNDTFGNLKLISTSGNILLNPNISNGNVILPPNINLVFGNNNSIYGNTNGTLNINSNIISISSSITSLNNSNGSLFVNNNNTNITSKSFIITGSTSPYRLLNTPTTGSYILLNVQNVKTTDPILSLANYSLTSNDLLDRGIEYNYYSSGNMALGYFGWKNSSNQFVFYSQAINNGETISGTLGTFAMSNAIISNNISFVSQGSIDLGCGTISNVNTITGCRGTVNILATNSINASASNIFLNATNNIQIPYQIPLSFGDTNSYIKSDGAGNLTIASKTGNGTLTINANLQINGSSNTIYSTVTSYQNPLLIIGGVTGPTINDFLDRGILFNWNNGTTPKQGFFGFSNSTQTFQFIPSISSNNNGVLFGSLGNVQFANGTFNNLNVNCGTISNISLLTSCLETGLNISSSSIYFNNNTKLFWGNTTTSISASNGTLITQNLNVNCGTISNVSVLSACNNTGLNIVGGTTNSLQISTNNLLLPPNSFIDFATSNSSISGDGYNLFLNGYSININSSTVNISGNINIDGTLTATNISGTGNNPTDVYIFPVGEQQTQFITSIVNSSTSGSILITTVNPNYLIISDKVSIILSNSRPKIDGSYTVTGIINNSTFVISHSPIQDNGTSGQINSVWTTDPRKDIGIQFNYWNTSGNSNVTSGSINYHTAFLGYLHNNQTLTYYSQAIIENENQVLSGTLGNFQLNSIITNSIDLNGPLIGNTYGSSSINNVSIGQNTPQPASFTTLTNSSSASLQNVSLSYSVDRFTCSPLLPNINPNLTSVVSFVSVFTNNFFTASGTLGNLNIQDGQIKKIIMSNIGTGSIYTLFINNLIAPSQNCTPQRLIFKRAGQNAELVFDATLNYWILAGGNAYVSN